MIEYFDTEKKVCHVVVSPPVNSQDVLDLKDILNRLHVSWHIEFGRVYSIDMQMVNVLYEAIFESKKKIQLTVHKNKLYSYLGRLGFKLFFDPLTKEDVVGVSDVEVVLIGGSAGSTHKIIEIVKLISLQNISLVVVQHVQENKGGIFDSVLQAHTKHEVKYAQDLEALTKGKIYIAPNNKHLKIKNGHFSLCEGDKYNHSRPSISLSYESFSSYYKEKLLVIQECEYLNDGVDKLKYLKQNNSVVVVQKIQDCKATSMPQAAVESGNYDYVLDVKKMIVFLNVIDKDIDSVDWLEYFLEMVYEVHHYDFRFYGKNMLRRRIDVFMSKQGIRKIKDMISVVLFNNSALKALFLELSINVTEFFREPKSMSMLQDILLAKFSKSLNIKLWSAGCSSGEEPYSIAMLLQGIGYLDKSIIYATDFNNVVLQEAKNGLYPKSFLENTQKNYKIIKNQSSVSKHFSVNENYAQVSDTVKKKTLFFKHNLALDSSFNEFDIIMCKNVIIYFDVVLQEKVFKLFYDSLKFGGYLVLGKSEMLSFSFMEKFEKCSGDYKIFKKVA